MTTDAAPETISAVTAEDLGRLLEALDLLIWRGDATSLAPTFLGDRVWRVLGYPSDISLHGTQGFWQRVLHSEEREAVLALMREVASDGRERHCVHRLIRADGEARWMHTTVRSKTSGDPRGQPTQLVGLMLDITERRMTDRLVDDLRGQLLEQLPVVVWTVDRELRFTSAMGAGLADLGLGGGTTMHGITLFEYFQTDDPNRAEIEAHRRAMQGERVTYDSGWMGRCYACYVQPFRESQAGPIVGAIGVALDVTDRKALEAQRDLLLQRERKARTEAERATRTRDEMISIAAHEFGTPVAAITMTVQAAMRSQPAGATTVPIRVLHTIETQSRYLSQLIDELLHVDGFHGGRVALQRRSVDLADLVRRVLERLAPEVQSAGTVASMRCEGPCVGLWDPFRLEQVVTNLVSNALKYGGRTPVEVTVTRRDDSVSLVVSDQGPGIEARLLPFVFQPFERGVPTRHPAGLGLGLYIVKLIVEAHQGTVSASSERGRGATFTVLLPVQTERV